jgi:hypothetical protein
MEFMLEGEDKEKNHRRTRRRRLGWSGHQQGSCSLCTSPIVLFSYL